MKGVKFGMYNNMYPGAEVGLQLSNVERRIYKGPSYAYCQLHVSRGLGGGCSLQMWRGGFTCTRSQVLHVQ